MKSKIKFYDQRQISDRQEFINSEKKVPAKDLGPASQALLRIKIGYIFLRNLIFQLYIWQKIVN